MVLKKQTFLQCAHVMYLPGTFLSPFIIKTSQWHLDDPRAFCPVPCDFATESTRQGKLLFFLKYFID